MGKGKKKTLLIVLLLIVCKSAYSQNQPNLYRATDQKAMNHWVDSIFDSMTLDERIGQLFMIVADPRSSSHKTVLKNIETQKIGGVLFSKGKLDDQANSINTYQKASRIPLLISFDGEWGLSMRLEDTPLFPRNRMLGAIQDDELIRLYGEEVGRECNELGVHINFAPVLDVNVNPANPVIGDRSFGENQQLVSQKGIAYSKGLESTGVIAVGKHFPGHGDTSEDSHKTLPKINHGKTRLNEVELYPFVNYIQEGFAGVMTGHLSIPALDNISKLPTSLSPKIVTELLQDELGFTGLTFTDALVMSGATTGGKHSVCVLALLAGNDVLLSPAQPGTEFLAVKKAIKDGVLDLKTIEEKCIKVLRYKYIVGLNQYKPIQTKGLKERINTAYSDWLIQKLNEEAITLLENEDKSIPIQLGGKKIALLSMGDSKENLFLETLGLYAGIDHFRIAENASESTISSVFNKLKKYDTVICGIHSTRMNDYGGLQSLSAQKEVHLCFFISPYRLSRYQKSISFANSVTLAYENTKYAQKAAAEVIMGGLPAKGKLPVTISGLFDYGSGLQTQKVRLSYQHPKEVDMSESTLKKIDRIVKEGIEKEAFPGCQVLVAKDGVVVYNKSFGHFDYANTHPVQNTDIYDLASVTKAIATVPAVMKLYDTDKISLPDKLSEYIPELKGTDKAGISIRDALFHQSGLVSFAPFYMSLIDTKSYEGPLYSNKRDLIYRTEYDKKTFMRNDFEFLPDMVSRSPKPGIGKQVADSFYVKDDINKNVLKRIVDSKLRNNNNYLYGDLNFILLKEMVENVSQQPFDDFLEKEFFADLGANYTMFLPLKRIDKKNIAPTENDQFLRNQILIGHVHDEAAAVMGGVSGNAGLFSNANDVAKILQMLLNDGSYGGKSYVSEPSTRLFTETKSPNSRRGLGFDKPDKTREDSLPTSKSAPASTYGHTGYTGTCFWVDPDNKLIYIFLSNRVYPSRLQTQLTELGIRTKIQDVIYESLK